MLSIVIALVVGIGLQIGLHRFTEMGVFWSVGLGVLGFLGVNALINVLLKKSLEAAFMVVQNHIVEKQQYLTRKVNLMAGRATPKFQAEIEAEQAKAVREALSLLDGLQKFEKWNFMVRRQTNTIRAQFHYQLKEYDMADKYFEHSLLFDPLVLAMQMARCYKKNEMEQVKKLFNKGTRRFKDEKGVLIYALYSWILVQQKDIDGAIQVLNQAKTRAENDVLKQNLENLRNGHANRFSNAGLNDQWYALALEAPRMQRMRMQPGYGGPGMMGGRHH